VPHSLSARSAASLKGLSEQQTNESSLPSLTQRKVLASAQEERAIRFRRYFGNESASKLCGPISWVKLTLSRGTI
jgi:hypothetical protein